jgi:hypothetical protein
MSENAPQGILFFAAPTASSALQVLQQSLIDVNHLIARVS